MKITFASIDRDHNGYLTRDEIDLAEKHLKVKIGTLFVGITSKDMINGTTREEKLAMAKKYFGVKENFFPVGDEPLGYYNSSPDEEDYMLESYTKHCSQSRAAAIFKDVLTSVTEPFDKLNDFWHNWTFSSK